MVIRSAAVTLWALCALALPSCIGTSPEEQLRADQGRYDDGDEEHRPGQPCLVCHSSDYNPGGDVFAVAGTIFLQATDDDEDGLDGATVTITDALGRTFSAETNSAGNFMVEVEPGLAQPNQRKKGRLQIGFEPEYPLRVVVAYAGVEQEMESTIGRDGSCAGCHRGSQPATDRVEKVWIEEVP